MALSCRKKSLVLQHRNFVIFALFSIIFLAYFAFALPTITFEPPTLSDNSTTGSNWVFINVTSSEDLNQSLLEWGNSTGFTNVSMTNVSGMLNWYVNMTGLVDGTYNYTVWAENTTAGWNQTGRRFVTVNVNCTDASSDGVLDNIITVGPASNCKTDGINDQVQIQLAIDNATSGDTVFLNGTFYDIRATENRTIWITPLKFGMFLESKNNVTIRGNGPSTLLNASEYTVTEFFFGVQNSTNITITNLKLQSLQTDRGIYHKGCDTCSSGTWSVGQVYLFNVSNSTMSNMIFTGGTGFYGSNVYYTNFENNTQTCETCYDIGGSSFYGTSSDHNNITNNNITVRSNGAFGIRLEGAADYFNVKNNRVVGADQITAVIEIYSDSNYNNVENNVLVGNNAKHGITIVDSNYNLVRNNSVTDTRDEIIRITSNGGGTNTNNSVIGNLLYDLNNPYTGEAWGDAVGGVAIFATSAGNFTLNNCLIQGNTIVNTYYGVMINDNVKGNCTIRNNIIVSQSHEGIHKDNASGMAVSNTYNDVWNNTLGNYNGTSAGTGDISSDPLFANASAGDFHLKSQEGRWNGTAWVTDAQTSPAIDAGDPASNYSLEPAPNGGRINMGAYGGTSEASKSPSIILSNIANKTPMATTVIILWNASSTTNNTVEYSNNSGLVDSNFSIWSNSTQNPVIKLWNLLPGTTYYYKVWSYNITNMSDYANSSIYGFTTPACISYRLVSPSNVSQTGIDHPIQEAIDMLCLTGGTIELSNGTFSLTSPVRIERSNVTVKGSGWNTTLNLISTIAAFEANQPRDGNGNALAFLSSLRYQNIVTNITIQNMSIRNGAQGVNMRNVYGGGAYYLNISNMTGVGIGIAGSKSDNDPSPPHVFAQNMTVYNNIIINTGSGISNIYTTRINWTNNIIDTVNTWDCFNLNSLNTYNIIKNNTFRNCMNNGIDLYSSSNYNTVDNNTIDTVQNSGIIIDQSWGNNITNNIIKNSRDGGVYLYMGGTPNTIKNNIIFNTNGNWNGGDGIGSGILLKGNGNYGNIVIESNTIFNNGNPTYRTGSGIYVSDVNTSSFVISNLTIKNNIITNNTKYGIYVINSSPYITGVNISYNDLWGNANGSYNNTFVGQHVGDISQDPLFANASAGDFHIQSQAGRWNGTGWVTDAQTSPAIDAGDPTDDYSLEPAPNGGRINIGAYGNTIEASKSPCTENWTYSDWSLCSGSTQTRTANDTNSCGTTYNQSVLSQSCTSETTSINPSSGGGGGGGTTIVQNKTNQTTKNATIITPPPVNTTKTSMLPQVLEDPYKTKAYEKINEVRQKISSSDTKAKEKIADAENAYATGNYSGAYNLAVEAEELISASIPHEESKTNYAVYAVTLAVLAIGAYLAKPGLLKLIKKIEEQASDTNEPEPRWKPAAPKKEKLEIPEISVNEEPENAEERPEVLMPLEEPAKVDELDDIQKRLEAIRKRIRDRETRDE